MSVWKSILSFLDARMDVPQLYGWFHIFFLLLSFFALIPLLKAKDRSPKAIRRFVLITSIVVILLEVYKQINFSFAADNDFAFDYQWYAFPFQFCSTPMYIGLLAGLTRKGRLHESLCAYLATFSLFAGLSVMVYPAYVFIVQIGINIQTMVCHGSMITLGIYLLATGYVPIKHKTILKALPVFAVTVGMAMIMNEVAYRSGLLETDNFNMFYISPYCDPHLPVYSWVQVNVPYPFCLIIYIAGFTLAGYLMLLISMGIAKLFKKQAIAA